MAKDEQPPAGVDEGAAAKAEDGADLQEFLLLRAALALLPVYMRRVTLVDEPPPPRRRR